MNKLITEGEYLLAWFVYWISATVGGIIVGAISGGILGAILGMGGADMTTIQIVCGGLGLILGMVVSYILFRLFVAVMIVKKVESRMAASTQSQSVISGPIV